MDKLLTVENLFLFTLLVALLCNLLLLWINFRNINKLRQKNNLCFGLGERWLKSIRRIMHSYRVNDKNVFEVTLNEEFLIAEEYAKEEERK